MILHGIYNNGIINILEKDVPRITTTVEIIFTNETNCENKDEDIIDKLLSSPMVIENFKPLTRKEIYAHK
jgi:hypothetical protein